MPADPRHLPSYGPAEISRYLDVPVSTIRCWSLGQANSSPLVEPAAISPLVLSFINLVELHVLSAIRRKHRIAMPKVRQVLEYLQTRLQVARPLADERFMTDGADLFVDHYGALVNASQQGQLAMRAVLASALVRIEWDAAGQPVRLFPITRRDIGSSPSLIVIDPAVSGGRPVIHNTRIAVEVVAERFDAGESIADLVEDYGCTAQDIEEAVRCELKIAA